MKILKSIFYLFFPPIVGSIVGIVISPYIDYNSLIKPPLSPPSIVFPIAWTIIYILMGVSYFLYRKKDCVDEINIVYYLQLFVNAMWSIIFFVWKFRFFAIIWTIFLLFLVIYLFNLFLKNKKISAYLNIPYIIWLIFATYLTIGVYILN